MATQLNIVNDVLRRLREDEVSSTSSSAYSKLIAMFLNDAKEEMEDAAFWNVNATSVDLSITGDSATTTFAVTGSTDRWFMQRMQRDQVPLAFDITASAETQLYDVPLKEVRSYTQLYVGTPPALPIPTEFALDYITSGRGFQVELKNPASGARTWRTYWYGPQAELALDGTDDTTEIVLPERPLYLRTLYYALNERGEEMGEPGGVAEVRADKALAAALEIDMQVQKKSDQKDMTNLEYLRSQEY